ncbi:Carbohydrate kinase, FGGY, conserved site [Sesbania bispinosa]|nr:Carbohydrate kinase, FGGY, conserved site [Sesbania bispinosa]
MSKEEVFVAAIDQGTSSTRWVEHDPMEILESVKVCMAKALDKATADGYNVDKGLKAIGLTNQRETTVVGANPPDFIVHHLFQMKKLEKELSGGKNHFVESCGLPISTYFSAVKLLWMMENVNDVKEAIKKRMPCLEL